jgi:hypothetical protein
MSRAAPIMREGLQIMAGMFWDLGEAEAGRSPAGPDQRPVRHARSADPRGVAINAWMNFSPPGVNEW